MVDGSSYWVWRDQLLQHPDGRARGGEACVKCGNPVPSAAHWKHRDRHTCSERCNRNLARQFNARLRRGDLISLPPPISLSDPRVELAPKVFHTIRTNDPSDFPYEFEGFGPRHGDIIERDGVVTRYAWYRPDEFPELPELPEYAPHGLFAALHESGYMFVVVATETGNGSRLIHGSFTPEGERRDLFAQFRFNGENLTWRFEIIRDVVTGGEYDWEANVCVPATAIHPGCLWTPAYTANSERLRRISSSTARHTRRLRIEAATSERFDPLDVFTRDEWICGLCNLPVDRALRWPDPLSPSLDHVIPLVAGGEHSQVNTQLAHWICNVRKGAREDWVAPKAAQ